MIRTRIAPSPTGLFHIGTARTALFNYLYAKQQRGVFIVRIEDTDSARSTKEFEENIIQGLEWLGLHSDEGITSEGARGEFGPYRQSERTHLYRPYLEQLVASGDAYWDLTLPEEIERMRQEAQDTKKPFVYRSEYRDTKASYQEGAVLRFRVPDEVIWFEDKIKGKIEFDCSVMADFSIAKNLDAPLYNFVVVVDDELMQISHIIRGEDHISNTPKQILINRALGFTRKVFGHLPLILAPDRSKMSKRHGAVSIDQYRQEGYLPEALINYFALLGWNEGNDREEYSLAELIQKFSLKRVQKSGAIFNLDKLQSVNSLYLKKLPSEQKLSYGKKILTQKRFDIQSLSEAHRMQALELEFQRIKTLNEIGEGIDFLFQQPEYSPSILQWKGMSESEVKENLEWTSQIVYTIRGITSIEIEREIKEAIQANEKQPGQVLWPLRVALSGKEKSPSPFEIIAILGKEQSYKRVQQAIQMLTG